MPRSGQTSILNFESLGLSLLLPDKIASAHFPDKFTPSFFYPDKIKAARLKTYFIRIY
ncbi:MAG: hypothetical protein IPN25_08045 [Sphingobacteriales bacterium]|nr:hypothetical protein [Sphingobacteriales bacterium]